MVQVQLRSIYDTNSECSLNAFILPKLTAKLPNVSISDQLWPHLRKLQLADPEFSHPGLINMIIGADNYGCIIREGLVRGDPQTPIAQYTIFGWILSGPVNTEGVIQPALHCHTSTDIDLKDILIRFWEQEELPKGKEVKLNKDEAECEQHFVSTHSRTSTGRYVVRLPFKRDPSVLGESKPNAIRSLRRLEQPMSTDSTYQLLYVEFLNEYQTLGHMSPNLQENSDNLSVKYYLPHHGVLREDSSSTKLRVVFNGSSRTTTGIFLNEILHSGAKLQTNIFDVLLWTRIHKCFFATDITKMFRQIAVHPEDWDLQRIMWRNQNQQLQSYSLTTVTYGLTCAPFLALRSLQQLIQDKGHRFPKAVASLTRGRYVDDIYGGADDITEAKQIVQVKQLCSAGGFPLQKWKSNHCEILPLNSRANDEILQPVELQPMLSKILGLVWKPETDIYQFFIKPPTISQFTKRNVLSDIAKLYDPLGLIAPVLIQAKIILQEIWLAKLDWDETLPLILQDRWFNFRTRLQELESLSKPRWLGLLSSDERVEIHGFVDASNLAMAAAVYVRIVTQKEKGQVRLVCLKTKVAPLKRMTIPRMELTAALILTKLVLHVRQALDLTNSKIYLWSDSSVTLSWIRANPSRWKDFVSNRVSAIQKLLPKATWKYVSGKENPADSASRGLRPDQLESHVLWWYGPAWLESASQLANERSTCLQNRFGRKRRTSPYS